MQRRDARADGLDHADGCVAGIKRIFDPVVPVRAGIEEAVEDDVLRAGAHEREVGADEDLALAGLAGIEILDQDLLLGGENETLRDHVYEWSVIHLLCRFE